MGQEEAELARPGKLVDASALQKGRGPEEGILKVFDVSDGDNVKYVGWGVGLAAGDGPNKVAGGRPVVPVSVGLIR